MLNIWRQNNNIGGGRGPLDVADVESFMANYKTVLETTVINRNWPALYHFYTVSECEKKKQIENKFILFISSQDDVILRYSNVVTDIDWYFQYPAFSRVADWTDEQHLYVPISGNEFVVTTRADLDNVSQN